MRAQPSRIRKFLWESIQIKFSKKDLFNKKVLGEEDLTKLLSELLESNSDFTLKNVLKTVFKIGSETGKTELTIGDFTQIYLNYCGENGLKTYNAFRKETDENLSFEDFYNLFIGTFKQLDSMRVKQTFLKSIFNVIDADKDSLVSLQEYLFWIKDFISAPHPLQNQRKRYYVKDDDLNIEPTGQEPIIIGSHQNKAIVQNGHVQMKLVQQLTQPRPVYKNFPKFSNEELGQRIIQHTVSLLSRYALNCNGNFEISKVEEALIDLLKSDQSEVHYAIVNAFRYNSPTLETITYESIAKFFLACHCGQMTIKRMHMKSQFSCGDQLKMNEKEFLAAFGGAMSVINFPISDKDLIELFYEIDINNDGWISYSQFFEFQRYFFKKKNSRISVTRGNSRIMNFGSDGTVQPTYTINNRRGSKAINKQRRSTVNLDWSTVFNIPQGKLQQSLGEAVRRQLKAIIVRLDQNKVFEVSKDTLPRLFFQIFDKTTCEIEYAMRNVLRYHKNIDQPMTYDQLTRFLIQIQFGQLALEAFKSKKNLFGSNFKINFDDFVALMKQNCYYIGLDPSSTDLMVLFKGIDRDNDGFITASEFFRFIKIYLAGNIDIDDLLIRVFDYALVRHDQKEQKKTKMKKELAKMIPLRRGQSKQVKEVVTQLYTDLKGIFDKYDQNNDEQLDDRQFQSLLRGLLKENSQQQLDYIFWNMFRVDKKGKGSVQFQDFASFILKHSAEITLQRFHAQQKKGGKNTIDLEQFKLLMNGAYHFISAIKKDNLHIIFQQLDKDGDKMLSYGQFLGWILRDIAPKIK